MYSVGTQFDPEFCQDIPLKVGTPLQLQGCSYFYRICQWGKEKFVYKFPIYLLNYRLYRNILNIRIVLNLKRSGEWKMDEKS